jgi:hypothetical protein
MRYDHFSENGNDALEKTIAIIDKTFSPERRAISDAVLQVAREVEMGKGDVVELAAQIKELTKNELAAKQADPDISISVDQNIRVLKASFDKLMDQNTNEGEEEPLVIKSKKSIARLRNDQALRPIQVPKLTKEQEELVEQISTLVEKNVPTNPSKWSYYKSQAKKKFEVYPSAYANAWAAKKYKAAGGGWRKG